MAEDPTTVTRAVGARRLATGLAQGLFLFLMFQAKEHKVWPANDLAAFQALLLPLLFAPLALIHAHSHLPGRRLAMWLAVVALACAAVGFFDGYKNGGALDVARWEPGLLLFATAAGLFIAQTLVLAAQAEGRRIARYATYFDAAWKHAVQVAAGIGFAGALWLLLNLGAGLFKLIKLTFLSDVIHEAWFAIPVTTMALAIAIHLTDVRASLVRGIRTLALTLLSWLLPLLTVIVAGFVVSLPFTGLQPLWDTNFAAGLLLAVSAALIILINAAYQDGLPDTRAHPVLRWAMTAGAILPAPLVMIAAYALSRRVAQYGWTAERVYALACVVVGACYAAGYFAAAARRTARLKTIEHTNIATAFVVIGIIALLFTPVADPARIAVSSQMARLEKGLISPDAFDYKYLRFQGGRYGLRALERMKAGEIQVAGINDRAAQALALNARYENPQVDRAGLMLNITPAPGQVVPRSFLEQDWTPPHETEAGAPPRAPFMTLPCLHEPGERCEAFVRDLDGNGIDDLILISEIPGPPPLIFSYEKGVWTPVGQLPARLGCTDTRALLKSGDFKTAPSRWPDLEIGGLRMEIAQRSEYLAADCPKPK
jgi:energy-converting hydrogenase Eha subunit A